MDAVLACIGVGSNLGDRESHINTALAELSKIPGCAIDKCSKIYHTPPWGIEDQPEFLNAVCGLMCESSPYELLNCLKGIESEHDRVRHEKWGSRTLDLDIIAFGEERLDTPELTIPHAYFKERRFVLEPLAEIYPDLRIEGTSVRQHFKNWLREFS